MHPQPRRTLQSLLRQYGPGLASDPQRTEALLSDLCGEFETEIFVLVHAQRAGILAEMTGLAGQRAEGALRQRLARRLQDRYAFSAEAAAWAVDAWAEALNIRAMPIYQGWLTAIGHRLRGWVMAFVFPNSRAPRSVYRAGADRAPKKESIFDQIGVQWEKLSGGALRLVLLMLLLSALVVTAWQSGWLESVRSLAVRSQAVAIEAEWQPPSPASAATALAVSYPPPRQARIEADLLNVRAAPALDSDVLGKVGPLGANVTVDGYSPDGAWSHITAPVAGWISNEYVTFAGLYLRPSLGQVTQAGSVVRSEPRGDALAIETLVAGQTLILVAFSADGQWQQVVEPSPGWVQSRTIAVMER